VPYDYLSVIIATGNGMPFNIMQYFIYEPAKDKLIYIVNHGTKPFSGSIGTAIHMVGDVVVAQFDCQYYIALYLVSLVVLRTPHSTCVVTSSVADGAFFKIKPCLVYLCHLAGGLVCCGHRVVREDAKPAVGADGGLGEYVVAFFAATLPS